MNPIEFRNHIAMLENEPLFLKESCSLVFPSAAPEDGGGMDIGFGHKITPSEKTSGEIYGTKFNQGLIKDQCLCVLEYDIQKHMNATSQFVGPMKFESLPLSAKQLLCDFSFNGALPKFPKFILSIFDKNLAGVLANYKRYWTSGGKKLELTRRNEFAYKLIQELIDGGYFGKEE